MLSRGISRTTSGAMLESLLPKSNNRCGRWRDHRQVINGVMDRVTGCQWRELPAHFGPWQTITNGTCSGRSMGEAVIDKVRIPRLGPGRPRQTPVPCPAGRPRSWPYAHRESCSCTPPEHLISSKRKPVGASPYPNQAATIRCP
ncbi:transposase [Streptomyces decoyicus]|uniref:transposase n=1 Tax=Streptomyces decoyicus TaxID=249567 RepID=UPI0036272C76